MRLYPGDRLALMGEPERLARAEVFLGANQVVEESAEEEGFALAEIPLAADSHLADRSLAEMKFREHYLVTVIGIKRGEQQLPSPGGKDLLQAGDSLIVAGKSEVVKKLESRAPL